MLDLLSAGLLSGWLKMAGLPTSFDPSEMLDRVTVQTPFWQASDPDAEKVVKDYLKFLNSQGLKANEQGIWLQSGANLLLSNQGTTPVPAASLTKVATSLAALQTWGVDHQFETLIGTTGAIENGVLQGDLVIQGGGDPLFVWEDAIALGNALNQLGITRVTGDLVITGSFMLNFRESTLQSGELLKQALNSKTWDSDIRDEFGEVSGKRPTIEIKGKVRTGAANQPTILLKHRSLPLVHVLKYLNVHSQNEMAQMLADNLGGVKTVIEKAASAANVSPNELLLANGSGLGVENRISPHAACAMFAALDRTLYPLNLSIADFFPASGIDRNGTLEDRSVPEHAVIKTGTLREVSALAGVLPTRDRGLIYFAVINRGTDILELRYQQDLLLQALQKVWGANIDATVVQPSPWLKKTPSAQRIEVVQRG
ncbi:D-alanyl-D-alanine carboxypeptidase [Leptolyngbya sp. GGD]|uniref:D-alanyl-D-alanine carboxypeptidase n=1 Tax=Leptolyngbya sp. GGD TaxID=2997907 RepID=UPI00227C3117|nr:D-alanyl-D-alanine carboxypeptidase [Leptolyngbya sp. GGD]MCY6489925.1 D-alanyl-D-alanine carboxypeptidase [Leptolyngbya sp. GGD]